MDSKIESAPRQIKIDYNGVGVIIDIRQLDEYNHGVHGEVNVSVNNSSILKYESINFSSRSNLDKTEARCNQIVTKYKLSEVEIPWDQIWEDTRIKVIEHYRKGDDVVEGWTNQDVNRPEFYVYPFIPRNETTIFFAEVESCKSLIASLFAGLIGACWQEYPSNLGFKINWPANGGSALVLDNETNYNTYLWNMKRLANGYGMDFPLQYRRLRRSLSDDIEQVKFWMKETKANFLVIDSLMRAAGGDVLKTDSVNKFFDAIDYLETTTLVLAHMPKSADAGKSIYGNAFFQYLPRSVWRIEKTKETNTDSMDIGLFHVKGNLSKKFPPVGFNIKFNDDNDSININPTQLEKTDLKQFLDVSHKILNYLLELKGTPADYKSIASAIDEKEKTVQSKLTWLKKQNKIVSLGNGWALRSQQDNLF